LVDGEDEIVFGSGIGVEDLALERRGADLIVAVRG